MRLFYFFFVEIHLSENALSGRLSIQLPQFLTIRDNPTAIFHFKLCPLEVFFYVEPKSFFRYITFGEGPFAIQFCLPTLSQVLLHSQILYQFISLSLLLCGKTFKNVNLSGLFPKRATFVDLFLILFH